MSESRPDSALSLLAFCGIIGPILYTIVVFTLGFLRPGYDHIAQSMSELGEVGDPNAIIMNTVGFPLSGLLLITFAFGLHRGLSESEGSRIGPALIAISGVGLILTGIFPCDPSCVDVSFTGRMHSICAMIPAFGMMFAPLAISQRLDKDSRWQNYRSYSIVTGIITAIIAAMYGFNVFEPLKGALQRASMAVPLLWVEVMAIKLLRLSIRSRA